MKLPQLPGVLFDEFPTDSTVKFCFFTRPKYPAENYSQYSDNVIYCGHETTLNVMASFTKLSIKKYCVLTEPKSKFKLNKEKSFFVRALPTDCLATPIMLWIYLDNHIHMYTGAFSKCREVILNQLVPDKRIKDIYVDNTAAALRQPCSLNDACTQIEKIVSDHKGYTIFLHIDLFGYEDLLYKLARKNIKIKLYDIQKYLFKQFDRGGVFDFDGEPQITVCSRIKEGMALEAHQYETFFETQKALHIKFIVPQRKFHWREKVKGLFWIPYTPHASAIELNVLFQTLKPERVHPLIPIQMDGIPMDLLNDGCEIGDDEYEEHVRLFLDSSEDSKILDSQEVSDPIYNISSDDDDDDELDKNSVHQKHANSSHPNQNEKMEADTASKPIEIETIEIDDDSSSNDLGLSFNSDDERAFNPLSHSTPKKNMKLVETSGQQTAITKENDPKTSSGHPTKQQQEQRDTVPAAPTGETIDANAVQATAPSMSTECVASKMQRPQQSSAVTPNRRASMGRATSGNRRKTMKRRFRILLNRPLQYLANSDDDESSDENQRKRFRPKQKENTESPAQNIVQVNVNSQKIQTSDRRLSQIDDNVVTQTGNMNSSCQHGISAKGSHTNGQQFNNNQNSSHNNNKNKAHTSFNDANQSTNEIGAKNRNEVQIQNTAMLEQCQTINASDSDSDSDSTTSFESLVFPDHY